MSNLSLSQRLGQIARMNKYYHGHRAAFYEPVKFGNLMGEEILTLAREVSGNESLLPSQILTVLFPPEVERILRSLANLYWFWVILEKACSKGIIQDEDQVPDVAAVQRAMEVERSFVARRFDINRDHQQLNGVEIACWMANGVLLLVTTRKREESESSGPYEYSLMRNPIFYISQPAVDDE